MSDPYVAARIREALVAAEGSRAQARRILLGWVQEDDRLLRGLAAPFLKAIVTGAVERATRPRVPAPASAAVEVPRRELSPEALDLVLSQMGRRQPGAAAPRPASASGPATAQRGEALAGLKLGTVNVPPPTKAGDAHVRTIKALAQLYKRRRDV
jgi:hypothetical protein